MAQVSQLFLAAGSCLPMREVEIATALADRGLEGCRHSRLGSRRQVLVMDGETLERFGLHPGQIKENITTSGLCLGDLSKGQRLEVGEVVLEVNGPCEPCSRMDEIRLGLQQELQGQRGVLCRVITGGRMQRGDAIQLASTTGASLPSNTVSRRNKSEASFEHER